MSKFLGRLQTLRWRERKVSLTGPKAGKKTSTLDGLPEREGSEGELEQPPTREQRARWRHSITGYPTLIPAMIANASDDDGDDEKERSGSSTKKKKNDTRDAQPRSLESHASSFVSRGRAADGSTKAESVKSSASGLSKTPQPRPRLDRERSRSFSSDSSSNSLEALFPVAEVGLCYPWDSSTSTKPSPQRKAPSGAVLTIPALPARRNADDGKRKGEKEATDKHKNKEKEKERKNDKDESMNETGGGRQRSSGESRIRERKRPAHGKSRDSKEREDKDSGAGGALLAVPTDEKSHRSSSDYLWGIVPDTDSSQAESQESDAELSDEEDHHEKEHDKEGGKERKEKEKEEKAAKKKRISLRLFSTAPRCNTAAPTSPVLLSPSSASTCASSSFASSASAPSLLNQNSLISTQTTSTSTSASAPTLPPYAHTSLSSSAPSPTPSVSASSGVPRDIPAASILAAVGSGHFSSFSPAQPLRPNDNSPTSPKRLVRRYPDANVYAPITETISDEIVGSTTKSSASRTSKFQGATSAPPGTSPRRADATRSENSETRMAEERSSDATASTSTSTTPTAGEQQDGLRQTRRLRPGSCSIEELLSVDEVNTDSGPAAVAADPPEVPMTSRDVPRVEKVAHKSDRYERMSMLSTVGGGGAHGGAAARRSRLYGTLLDSAKSYAGVDSSDITRNRSRSRSGDTRLSSVMSTERASLASGGSHLGRLTADTDKKARHAQDRRNKDYEWRKSWSPSLMHPPPMQVAYGDESFQYSYPSEAASRESRATGLVDAPMPRTASASIPSITAPTVAVATAPASFPQGVPSRTRSNTLDAPPPYSENGGDRRVLDLLEEIKLMKYWPKFLQEEILLEDLDGMKEKDLIVDFEMTKWHAKRLLRAIERLQTDTGSLNKPTFFSSSTASPFISATQVMLPSVGSRAAASAVIPAGNSTVPADQPSVVKDGRNSPIMPSGFSETSPAGENPGDIYNVASTLKKADKKKDKKKKKRKERKRRKKEREKIKKEWEKLRQERERLANERLTETQEKGKKSIADLEFRELNVADIEYDDKVIAHGRFGVVFKGRWRGVECALKQLRVDVAAESEESDRLMKAFKKEASLMQALGYHPNCICFFGAVTLGGRLCLVSEWAANGSVYDLLIKRKKDLPLKTLVKLARDAACGILHLHSEKVIHRDIAARNVLVGPDYTGKISDLGLSRVMTTTITTDSTSSNIGAVKWMSPESITTNEYNEKSDAFSFGVLLWEMITRETPWGNHAAMQVALMVVNEGKRLTIPENCDQIFAGLMNKCFATDPQERPDFHEIFTTLNNYYRKLEAAEPRQESSRRIRAVLESGSSSGGFNNASSISTGTTSGESGALSSGQHADGPANDSSSSSASSQRGRLDASRLQALLLQANDESSDDSDSESSSSSSSDEDELIGQEVVLEYARVADVNNVLAAARGGEIELNTSAKTNRMNMLSSGDDSDSDSSEDEDPASFFPLLRRPTTNSAPKADDAQTQQQNPLGQQPQQRHQHQQQPVEVQ